jgi:hypothetical protein
MKSAVCHRQRGKDAEADVVWRQPTPSTKCCTIGGQIMPAT